MGSPSELSLDYKPNGYSKLPKSSGSDQPDQLQNLEEFLSRLEEERDKIDAFKRELPLCMQLLTNAIETYRQQLEIYHANQGTRPVLEEFMPLKHGSTDGSSEKLVDAPSEKASWMTSAQLWSQATEGAKQPAQASTPKDANRTVVNSPKLALDNKQRNGGAFLPFSKDGNNVQSSRSRLLLPDLALSSTEKDNEEKRCSEMETGERESCGRGGGGTSSAAEQGKVGSNLVEGPAATQTHRKARRCWSPDLHRRFVNALQMLGGSQVATPKQIRELMKVDGLTNDEVKSHLQKYRLHTRRPIQAPQSAVSAAAPQLVVLGGIWVPPEYATSAAGGPGIYSTHPGPAHYCAAAMPPDFYPAPPHHHSLHLSSSTAVYKGMQDSPESDFRGAGERSESIEDGDDGEEGEGGNSESSGWKGGDEKALVPMTEDSNGSDVTLKV